MDLRRFGLTRDQALQGARLLDYQPFVLADDIQTGVAYEWLYPQEAGSRYVAFRKAMSPTEWEHFGEANAALRRMYDEWIEEICRAAPQAATALDIACSSGYFLQKLALQGYRDCVGYDVLDKTEAFAFLNGVLGTGTRFVRQPYNSWTHTIPGCRPADVVIASAILLHISDPLYFLKFLGDMAKKLLFLFTRVVEAEEYVVVYGTPNMYDKDAPFPLGFDNNNFISTGLLEYSLRQVGFRNIIELPHKATWVPEQVMGIKRVYMCLK
jgi:SAM-dependent methyltransferase